MIGHRVVLRPRSFFETADLGLILMRLHARAFAWLLPWTVIPAALCYALHAFSDWTSTQAITLLLALSGVSSGVYTLLCGDLMLQERVSLKDVQKRFLRGIPLFLVSRLAGWMLLGMTFGLGYAFTAFIPEGAQLERGNISATFNRSRVLLRATPGRSVALGLALAALFVFGAVGAELVHQAMRELFGLQPQELVGPNESISWAPFLGIALVQPYVETLRFLLYIDCRTRREGWDLQVQFSALMQAAASPLRHKQAPVEAA